MRRTLTRLSYGWEQAATRAGYPRPFFFTGFRRRDYRSAGEKLNASRDHTADAAFEPAEVTVRIRSRRSRAALDCRRSLADRSLSRVTPAFSRQVASRNRSRLRERVFEFFALQHAADRDP